MNIDKLINENDLCDINILENENCLTIDMKFVWEEDYGVFSKVRRSDLTILAPKDLWEIIQNDIDNKKGLVYNRILNHKSYIGELLDFFQTSYKGVFYEN